MTTVKEWSIFLGMLVLAVAFLLVAVVSIWKMATTLNDPSYFPWQWVLGAVALYLALCGVGALLRWRSDVAFRRSQQ